MDGRDIRVRFRPWTADHAARYSTAGGSSRGSQADLEAHRRMLAKAELSLAGGPEPSVPVDEIRALIRRRLDE
jgi:hypothetical protein